MSGTPFPEDLATAYPAIYPPLRPHLHEYLRHRYFGTDIEQKRQFLFDLNGSQAACVNLFLPLLLDPDVGARVLRAVKTDIAKIDTRYLVNGACFDYYSRKHDYLNERPQGQRTKFDFALAYRGRNGELRLWGIDCRMIERELAPCPVDQVENCVLRLNCDNVCLLKADPGACYLQAQGFRYWNTTNRVFDVERMLAGSPVCPFRDGANELWRKQLLAQAIEDDPDRLLFEVRRVTFSVLHHPLNRRLDEVIERHQRWLRLPSRFFEFDTRKLLRAARKESIPFIRNWLEWFEQVYPQDNMKLPQMA